MSFLQQTSRFYLRPFHEEDAPFLFGLNNDPEVLRYTGDDPFLNEAAALAFIQTYNAYDQWGYGRWMIIDRITEEALGWCGLKYHPNSKETDLGYRVARTHWGRGVATECAKAAIAAGFKKFGLERIIGRTAKENIASVKILEKCGMRLVGSRPCHGIVDALVYEIQSN